MAITIKCIRSGQCFRYDPDTWGDWTAIDNSWKFKVEFDNFEEIEFQEWLQEQTEKYEQDLLGWSPEYETLRDA